MRNISFMLTTKQVIKRTKTVTRRLGWKNLKIGDRLQGCEKCQGLKPGEPLVKLAVIHVNSVTREKLNSILSLSPAQQQLELAAEGFPDLTAQQFIDMFCEHMNCPETEEVTRIEFEYV